MKGSRYSRRSPPSGTDEPIAPAIPYVSVFAHHDIRPAIVPGVAQLDDYETLRKSVLQPDRHRLGARIAALKSYPLPPPVPRYFSENPPTVAPPRWPIVPSNRPFELRWTHFLTFWWIPELRREHDQRNDAERRRYEAELGLVHALGHEDERQRAAWASRKARFEAQAADALRVWTEGAERWQRAYLQDLDRLGQLKANYQANDEGGVAQFFDVHLAAVPLPSWCPRVNDVLYDASQRILLIDANLPYFGSMPVVKERASKAGSELVPANQKEAREFASKYTFLLVLRLLWEVVHLDQQDHLRLVCCNGTVAYDDPATGRHRRDVILSIAAKPEEIRELLLDRVEPEACFRKLRGVAAPRLADVVPIAPVLHFDMADSRFIEGKDVLYGVAGTNLATMDWQDFEHLIRELFEKAFATHGAEVRVTQASRDRGVDAVVFDPDPLLGGRTIVQAKRYTNTVDVSAVRDLFGTVQAEGANKGILVTTSNFGPDAHAFARGKPLTLINGAELLHLLGTHGYHARIDLKQAKELLGGSDRAPKRG